MFGRTTRLLAAAVTLAIVGLVGGAGAQSASAQSVSNALGSLKVSKVTGDARNGATFVGRYNVQRFVTTDTGRTKAVGKLVGTLTRPSGATQHVSKTDVRMLVRPAASSVTGPVAAPGTVSTSAVGCEVLDLVLGPLDLNLLGLQVHLDRVHLNITAVPGAGNLLGNLLCAVAGLLDGTGLGGLSGLGAVLTNILNSLLGLLNA